MIDTAIYLASLVMMVIAVLCMYASTHKDKEHLFGIGIALVSICLFRVGVEMITPSESPWAYLMTQGTEDDLFKALMGGSLMMTLPVLLFAVCGKDLARILESKPNSES